MDNFREALVEDEAETAIMENRASDLKARMKVRRRLLRLLIVHPVFVAALSSLCPLTFCATPLASRTGVEGAHGPGAERGGRRQVSAWRGKKGFEPRAY